jgi:ribose/xylose/arabinose/galactoside ABC-type transport system permease subunit
MVWIMIGLMIIYQMYLAYIPGGRRLYYLGGNYKASRQMGISVKWVRIKTFMLCSTLASLAGVLVTARAGIANRYTGENAHMDVIIACIIGGGSLAGGQGSVIGAFFGMAFMVLMSNAFNLYTIPPQWQNITIGVILMLVLAADGYLLIVKQKKLGRL